MKTFFSIILISLLTSSCSFFQPHKLDIEQGNYLSTENLNKIHRGMTTAEVKRILGEPVLTNIFTPNRLDYVYTLKIGHQNMSLKKISCLFENDRLRDIQESNVMARK